MNKRITYGLTAVFAIGLLYCFAMPRRISQSISTAGQCIAKVPRDKFAVTLQIESVKPTAAASLQDAQAAADEIVQNVKKINDKTMEIQTKNINSFEKTEWKNNSSVVLGIETDISLEITTSNKDTLNEVLNNTDVSNKAHVFPQGMRNFSSYEAISEATEKCIQDAIIDARNKAEAIASVTNNRLGRLISAQLGNVGNPTEGAPMPMMMAKVASNGDYIQTSEGDLSITVSATFGIK